MSTGNEREALRRAMLRAVEGIEPRGDGLQRIQTRLRAPRPAALAWAEAVWTGLRMRVPAVLQEVLEWLRGVISMAWERFGPRSGMSGGRASRALGWLRPAVALGVTVFIVAVGAYVAIDAQQAMFPSSSNSSGSNNGAGGVGGGSKGHASNSAQSQSTLGSPGGARPSPKATCRPARSSAGAGPSASSSTGQILNNSPSTGPSDSSSGSPSPSATDTSSPTPGVSATVQAAISTGGTGVTAATAAAPVVLTRNSAATSGLPICGRKHRVNHNPSGPTPNVRPAVFSYGRLDEGS